MTPREIQQAARIRQLLDQNEQLRDQIAVLQETVLPETLPDTLVGLTRSESVVLGLLARRAFASKAQIYAALYAGKGEDRDPKVVDVFICKIRRALENTGIEIETVWGEGYRIVKGRELIVGPAPVANAEAAS